MVAPMFWAVVARFTSDPRVDRWLVPFVPGSRHRFELFAAPPSASWHQRTRAMTGARDWVDVWRQGSGAWSQSGGGVITVFPQLAFAVGLRQRTALRHRPVIAWCFNMGALYGGIKGQIARLTLGSVDRFVVHSRAEIARYSAWLDLPEDRFRFVHLQRAFIPIEDKEDERHPFVLAMGSARRDYATLFEAVRVGGYPTVVVAARHAIEGLDVPVNVEVRSSLSERECHRLAQRARVNVVPVLNQQTASGQVTVVEAMRMGRAVVATRCIGSEDYIEDGANGLLVEPGSVDDLRGAIGRLWDDAALRDQLGRAAERFIVEYCSDEAAGAALGRVLDEVEDQRGAVGSS